MRLWVVLLVALLGGCQGHVADYVGPREGIISPQLIRYGYDLAETRCVSQSLTASLNPLQLRLFARAAGSVTRGYFDPDRLDVRDLVHVSGVMGDDGVKTALAAANKRCNVPLTRPVVVAIVPQAPRPPSWLNLGAAESEQSIAIDASSIRQEGETRTAWFRLTDPGQKVSPDIFLLTVDCQAQTINAKERKRLGTDGSATDRIEYPDNPLKVEKGTVMQIAWLSLCT